MKEGLTLSGKQCICSYKLQKPPISAVAEMGGFVLVGKFPNPLESQVPCELRTLRALIAMDLQDKESTSLPLYQQLREAETSIQNLLNAIQQGILTKSTKSRLEELEAAKEDLKIKIANEKIAKPRISPEFVTFWLHKFRKLDVRQQSRRKMLIDAFVNAIYLYDDKLFLAFNNKDGARTITLDDVKEAAKANAGSDLDCRGAPKKRYPNGGSP